MGGLFGSTAPNYNSDYSVGPGWGGTTPQATYTAPQMSAPSTVNWSGLGNVASQALPIAAMMGSGYLQGQQAKKTAQQTAQQNQQTWQQNAYPNAAAVNAQATENRGELGQARSAATKDYFNQLASRGWGSGSGVGAAGLSTINKGYLQSLGQNATAMTKLKNTPMFGMPSQAYVSPVSGGTEQALQGLDYALGQLQAQQLLRQLMGR